MKTEFHPANERGHANHGWLDTFHSFSFATYFNPAREQFGCLRVLNDDTVEGGTGFDLHPHNNMEIITILLKGALEHRDSMGNIQVIRPGEVQVMTAGTGIYHAEYNHSDTEQLSFLQLWIFPKTKGLKPRYDQMLYTSDTIKNELLTLVTPDNDRDENALWIHQDAYISRLTMQGKSTYDYSVKIPGNGVYLFVIEGDANVHEQALSRRDALGISETPSFEIQTTQGALLLLVEVPMQ